MQAGEGARGAILVGGRGTDRHRLVAEAGVRGRDLPRETGRDLQRQQPGLDLGRSGAQRLLREGAAARQAAGDPLGEAGGGERLPEGGGGHRIPGRDRLPHLLQAGQPAPLAAQEGQHLWRDLPVPADQSPGSRLLGHGHLDRAGHGSNDFA